ncbi:hypothetical protein EIP91_009425 [Steccherinum ochraceum]|uniref:Peptidase S54 rhomboid domain-containing protein n=1 Tax=Steccherinum ochraceum TaxID=92696 RepID=A0A4R0R1L9_9APHY|nr:hypothetical protein EIP91_009425 [Steccherinum ochraceum]
MLRAFSSFGLRSYSPHSRLCTPRHLPPTHRSFSFTPNFRLPRIPRSAVDPPPLPSFRKEVNRAAPEPTFSDGVKAPSIRNQVMFFIFGSFVVYQLAARQTNIETAEWTKRLSESGVMWKFRAPSSDEMRRARHFEFGKELKAGLAKVQSVVEQWPSVLKNVAVWSYVQVFQPILDTSDGKRMAWTIGMACTAVWMLWKIPRLEPFMRRSFTHTPLSGLSYTLLTSTFSHSGIFHLVFNCMALASFGSAASVYMVKEQNVSPTGLTEANVKWHFLAFFVSAGLFSGLVSHIVKARMHFPRMVSLLRSDISASVNAGRTTSAAAAFKAAASSEGAKGSAHRLLPSLGASGAIYAAVTLTALAFPETEVALIFPPTFPIPIQYGVGGLVLMDVLGVLRGWRYFDHWAHLGGAAFGIWYRYYGMRMWDMFRVANLGPLLGQKKSGQ